MVTFIRKITVADIIHNNREIICSSLAIHNKDIIRNRECRVEGVASIQSIIGDVLTFPVTKFAEMVVYTGWDMIDDSTEYAAIGL